MVTAVLPVTLLALASCSSKPAVWKPSTSFSPSAYQDNASDAGGEVVMDSTSTTATVVSVDHAKRLVALKRADGKIITYKALPGALGFDDIQAGDVVKVSVAEELAVFLGKNRMPPNLNSDSTKLHIRMPNGTQAVAAEVGTVMFTAKVINIDDWADAVTLQLPDGSTKTIKVSEFVNLADVNIGDMVSVRSTESAVVGLEKP